MIVIELRPHASLGGFSNAWLTTKMHVAFGDLGAKEHGPIGALRVWNHDDVAPHAGFPMHGHRDVEIISYIREGFLKNLMITGGLLHLVRFCAGAFSLDAGRSAGGRS